MMTPFKKRYRLRTETAVQVVTACAAAPQNPYRYFKGNKGIRYAYHVFERLAQKGALCRCQAPADGRDTTGSRRPAKPWRF